MLPTCLIIRIVAKRVKWCGEIQVKGHLGAATRVETALATTQGFSLL